MSESDGSVTKLKFPRFEIKGIAACDIVVQSKMKIEKRLIIYRDMAFSNDKVSAASENFCDFGRKIPKFDSN